MTAEKRVLARKPYEPQVTETDAGLTYHLPVENRFISLLFSFPVTRDHLAVLAADEARYCALFAVLHARDQSRAPSSPPADSLFDEVLFGTRSEVESLLTERDRDHNGAVSNLVHLATGRPLDILRQGHWLDAP